MAQKRKILIATDGSESARDAVIYTSRFFDPEITEFTLIHIIQNNDDNMKTESAGYLEIQKRIHEKMDESISIFENAGYDKRGINIKVQKQIKGVARDIIAESEKGYDALVIGRRGLNDPTNIIVGATAYRMMKAIQNLPVVVVGDSPDPENVLIGIDGSDSAFRALDCVCHLMRRPLRKVVLCHVIHGAEEGLNGKKGLPRYQEKLLLDNKRNQTEDLMQHGENRLTEAGFEKSKIKREILEGLLSRAVAISKTAEEHNCGSLVVGRRGLSVIREFMMGRVTMKILHKAYEQTVWIV